MTAALSQLDRIVRKAAYGIESPANEEATENEVESFPTVRLLEGEAPQPPQMLVEKGNLDRDINLRAGHGGSAKTVLTLTEAVGIALGIPVYGSLQVYRPGPVLLVAPEDGQGGTRMMLDAIIEGHGLNATDRKILAERIFMVPDTVLVNLATDAKRLRKTALEREAVAVFVDPVANVIAGVDENDNARVSAICDVLRRELCWGAEVSTTLNHHNRKPGKDGLRDSVATEHDIRGAGAWVNSSRLAFGVSKKANRITMTLLKGNRLKTGTRHELDLAIDADAKNEAHWLSCRVTDSNAGAASPDFTPGKGRPLNNNERAALDCLDDRNEPDRRLSYSGWQKASELLPATFQSIRTRLIDAGLAQALATGRSARNGGTEYAYLITPQGRTALASGWAHD